MDSKFEPRLEAHAPEALVVPLLVKSFTLELTELICFPVGDSDYSSTFGESGPADSTNDGLLNPCNLFHASSGSAPRLGEGLSLKLPLLLALAFESGDVTLLSS